MPPEPCRAAESDAPANDAQPDAAFHDGPCPAGAVVELALKRADGPETHRYGTTSRTEEHE
jgi:hypothetical protein